MICWEVYGSLYAPFLALPLWFNSCLARRHWVRECFFPTVSSPCLEKLQLINSFLLRCSLKPPKQQQERKLAIVMAAAGQGLWKPITNVGSNKVNPSYLGCRKLDDHLIAKYEEFSVSHFSCPMDIWIFASQIMVEQERLRKAKGPVL